MQDNDVISIRQYTSPCGELTLGSYDDFLCACLWTNGQHADSIKKRLKKYLDATIEEKPSDITEEAARQLDEYFAGQRTRFKIPIILCGSDFQHSVWQQVWEVPYGTTTSYRKLATMVARPYASRAVANANGRNAVSIFVPCHRIIGSDGSLTGYEGGLEAKRFLLQLEGVGKAFL